MRVEITRMLDRTHRKRRKYVLGMETVEAIARGESSYLTGELYGHLRIPVMGEQGLRLMAKVKRLSRLRGRNDYIGMVESVIEGILQADERYLRIDMGIPVAMKSETEGEWEVAK